MWSFRLKEYLNRSGLQVAKVLVQFIEKKALPGTNVSAEVFWTGIAGLLSDLSSKNRELLDQRKELQLKNKQNSSRR